MFVSCPCCDVGRAFCKYFCMYEASSAASCSSASAMLWLWLWRCSAVVCVCCLWLAVVVLKVAIAVLLLGLLQALAAVGGCLTLCRARALHSPHQNHGKMLLLVGAGKALAGIADAPILSSATLAVWWGACRLLCVCCATVVVLLLLVQGHLSGLLPASGLLRSATV